jgi:hypothetical protein
MVLRCKRLNVRLLRSVFFALKTQEWKGVPQLGTPRWNTFLAMLHISLNPMLSYTTANRSLLLESQSRKRYDAPRTQKTFTQFRKVCVIQRNAYIEFVQRERDLTTPYEQILLSPLRKMHISKGQILKVEDIVYFGDRGNRYAELSFYLLFVMGVKLGLSYCWKSVDCMGLRAECLEKYWRSNNRLNKTA